MNTETRETTFRRGEDYWSFGLCPWQGRNNSVFTMPHVNLQSISVLCSDCLSLNNLLIVLEWTQVNLTHKGLIHTHPTAG